MSSRPAGTADAGATGALVAVVASVATAVVLLVGRDAWASAAHEPAVFGSFAAVVVVLQLMQVEVYGRGRISVAGVGALACGFTLGISPAIAILMLAAAVHGLTTRVRLDKALFNTANFALAAGGGAGAYQLIAHHVPGTPVRFAAAFAGGTVFWAINIGLLTLVMSVDERKHPFAIWRERFRWLTGHYLAFGPLALASTLAYEKVGVVGVLAFALPPALLVLSVRQYLHRTREAVEEVRLANGELSLANAELAARNDDLQRLFEFAGGLAARTHEHDGLVAYAEAWLSSLTGGTVRIEVASDAHGIPLVSAGTRLGALQVADAPAMERARWERISETVLPQLATAIESASLVERLRETHRATIAALSRSMEAKDYYTGGHTERVAEVAAAVARRLGYEGADLEAIEIGALLHDIGKIGIPERILHKSGPLDEEEWEVMRRHPVISDYILSEVDLHPAVRQVARSTHERFDGAGYPDGLAADEIPLPARIVAVADAFDALTSDRPYRFARGTLEALRELHAQSRTHFCPTVIAALEQVFREQPQVLSGVALHAVSVA